MFENAWKAISEYDPYTPSDAAADVAESTAVAAESMNQASDKLAKALVASAAIVTIGAVIALSRK